MFADQNGCCAICKESGKELVVDHCHESGDVRELLCQDCNSMLGRAKDSIETLKSSVNYLKKHAKVTQCSFLTIPATSETYVST
jgi:hypothetical protein